MTVGIVGLGLIGGSFAKAFRRNGCIVLARDTDSSTMWFAKLNGIIDGELHKEHLKDCDLILICTYPKAAIEFMEENAAHIGARPLVMDCCGTKRNIVKKGTALSEKYGFTYAGGHPMAGTQYSGIKHSSADMFTGAPMVIVSCNLSVITRARKLLEPCGFSQITATTAEDHDRLIAYTSQLAHVVSSAYVKSPTVRKHKGISAGSYRDMTRVACLSPELWTELCMDNREHLLFELDTLIRNLKAYRTALVKEDSSHLMALFAKGSEIKKEVDG